MEDLVEQLTRGNVSAVKVVLASVALALAVYQVLLMAVGYGKLRLAFLKPKAASFTHRASGDVILLLTLLVGFMCLAYFGLEDSGHHGGEDELSGLHVIASFALVGALALKVIVVRWWHRMGRFLPLIGISVFTLFFLTWLTSSAAYLWGE
jgi:uncharacterized protein DUF6529